MNAGLTSTAKVRKLIARKTPEYEQNDSTDKACVPCEALSAPRKLELLDRYLSSIAPC